MEEVDLDVDRFMKDMESVMKDQGCQDIADNDDSEEGSSSDMDFGKPQFSLWMVIFAVVFYFYWQWSYKNSSYISSSLSLCSLYGCEIFDNLEAIQTLLK